MGTILLWASMSLAIALIWKRSPHVVLGFILAAVVLIPSLVAPVAQYLVVAHLIVQMLARPQATGRAIAQHSLLFAVALYVTVFGAVTSWVADGSLFVELQYVAGVAILPVTFFVLSRQALADDPRRAQYLTGVLIALVVFEVGLVWLQFITGEVLVWESYFSQQWWWSTNLVKVQPIGTFGHWIPVSGFLAASLPFVWVARNPLFRVIVLLSALATIILIGARTGALIAVVGIAVMILTSLNLRSPARLLGSVLLTGTLSVTAYLLITSTFAATLIGKLTNDGTSTSLRGEATKWIAENWTKFFISGYEGDTDLRQSGVLGSSLENAFYMFALRYGVLLTLVLLAMFAVMALRLLPHTGPYKWAAVATSIGVGISFITSGSFGSGDSVGLMLFWLAMALGALPGTEGAPADDGKGALVAQSKKLSPSSGQF
ncbi:MULTISPECIES: hypothetical protein [Microbacterium]|uniref:O-antigen ligase family protein n=1 Tax=Microbacterium saccharophilum TaxID=1213358 RepID=A0A7Z7D448_9MICO|nr:MULTISPECIES: hypothetical protein [Microbacterium]SFI75685.1 hypothetical protein SAMN04487751_2879 [Microbacterium saccharophilum]